MSAQNRDLRAGRGVPDARSLVVRRGDDARTVRAESGKVQIACVSMQDADLLAGRSIPDPGGPVPRRRDDPRPVGAEGAELTVLPCPRKHRDFLARIGVPYASGPVPRRRDDPRAVVGKGRVSHPSLVSRQIKLPARRATADASAAAAVGDAGPDWPSASSGLAAKVANLIARTILPPACAAAASSTRRRTVSAVELRFAFVERCLERVIGVLAGFKRGLQAEAVLILPRPQPNADSNRRQHRCERPSCPGLRTCRAFLRRL